MSQLVSNTPAAEVLLNLTPILSSAKLCPKQAAANARDYQLYQQGRLGNRAARAGAGGFSNNVPFLPKLPTN